MPRNKIVYLFDEDPGAVEAFISVLAPQDLECVRLCSLTGFFELFRGTSPSCLLLDLNLSQQSALAVQQELIEKELMTPIVFVSAEPNLAKSVQAIKAGAVDVLLKPVEPASLISAVETALEQDLRIKRRRNVAFELRERFLTLTPRERQVLPLVIGGFLNKQAAAILGIAEVTLQVHRAQIMRKMRANSLPDLVRMAARLGVRHETNSSIRGGYPAIPNVTKNWSGATAA